MALYLLVCLPATVPESLNSLTASQPPVAWVFGWTRGFCMNVEFKSCKLGFHVCLLLWSQAGTSILIYIWMGRIRTSNHKIFAHYPLCALRVIKPTSAVVFSATLTSSKPLFWSYCWHLVFHNNFTIWLFFLLPPVCPPYRCQLVWWKTQLNCSLLTKRLSVEPACIVGI